MNHFLAETEKMNELEMDPSTVNYKDCLLESYKQIEDPFDREIKELNYEQNPGEPSALIKNIVLAPRPEGEQWSVNSLFN